MSGPGGGGADDISGDTFSVSDMDMTTRDAISAHPKMKINWDKTPRKASFSENVQAHPRLKPYKFKSD